MTKSKLLSELRQCSISRTLLERILPAWWNDELLETPTGLLEFGLLIKSRLGLNVNINDSGELQIELSSRNVEFKKRSNTDTAKLSPATSIGHGAASTMASIFEVNNIPPPNKESVINKLSSINNTELDTLTSSLWEENIPILYIDTLPSSIPRPAGMIIKIDEYICIILGHKDKSLAAQSFVLTHEVGHFISGHVDHTDILADIKLAELDDVIADDRDVQETEADHYALSLLRGNQDISNFLNKLPSRPSTAILAQNSMGYGKMANIPPGHLALSYGKDSNDWITARSALRFIEGKTVAKDIIVSTFEKNLSNLSVKDDELFFLRNLQGILY